MKTILFFLILKILSICCTAQEIKFYDLDINIDVKNRKANVKGFIDISLEDQKQIKLLLWKDTIINEISLDGNNIQYSFDTQSASPIIYIPNGGTLHLTELPNSDIVQQVYFDYDLNFSNVSGWGKSFNDDWIEIGYYTAWFPVHNKSKSFFSTINIIIDEDYQVSGSGVISKKENSWEMKHNWPVIDNVIIASRELKITKHQYENSQIDVVYTSFPETYIDSVVITCNEALNFYQQCFGTQDSSYLKFVLCPMRGGGGYGRSKYISLKASEYGLYIKKGIAHEMAHFWFNAANTNNWEDWLNEAFAEYSMLLFIRENVSRNIFEDEITKYREWIKNSLPIWGVDRATPEAYTALYNKGSIILHEFEKLIGKDRFYSFCSNLINLRITSTLEFLNLLETEFSKKIRNWFENKLKT